MIVRVLTARVPAEAVAPFNHLLRAQLDELRLQPGLVYAKLARRLVEGEGEEVVLFEEWATPADLWTWTNGLLAKPRLLPGTEDYIESLSIDHYESLDVDIGEDDRELIREATHESASIAGTGPGAPRSTGDA